MRTNRRSGSGRCETAISIITQTPLRIGLLGGGTDLPDYYPSTAAGS